MGKTRRKWNECYLELKAFKSKRGNCNVPWSQDESLGEWVHHQRHARKKGKLSDERFRKLDDLGFVWNMWDERLEELKKYKAKHGSCDVPKSQGPLAEWVYYQRKKRKKGKLSELEIRKLDDLGFVWNFWDERLKELKKYMAEHGNCNVPQRQGSLGWWVDTQRQKRKKGKLSRERIRNLDDIDFNWSPRGTSIGRQVQFRREKGQRGKAKTTNCASSPESGSSPEDGEVGTRVAVDGGYPGSLFHPDAEVQRSYFDSSRSELACAEENSLRDGADGRSSEPGEGDGGSRGNRRSRRIILRSDGNSVEAAPKEDDGGDAPSSVPRRAATIPRRSGSSAYGNPPPDPTAGTRPGAKKRRPSLEAPNPRTVRSRTRSESDMRIGDSAPAKSIARSSGSSDSDEEADPSQSSAMETEFTLMGGAEAVDEPAGNGSDSDGAAAASDDKEQPGPDGGADSDFFNSDSSEFVDNEEGDVAPGSMPTGDKVAGMAASAAAEHLTSEQIEPVDGAAKSRLSDEEDTAEDAGCPLETRLARARTANEANTRTEKLQNKVSSLSEAAAEMEDELQLADAEASIAARECESLRADIERMNRLHEEELAARDGALADRDEAITSLKTELAGSKSAEDEARRRAETLASKISTLLDVADESEDGLQLAYAEASLAARKGESLRADIDRTDRLHEEDLARAEAARDGDLADRDEAITTLQTELARARTANDEANMRAEELQNQVSTLSEAAVEMEDSLQLADAEAFIAARECESLHADLERTNRLHEEELARAEAARDGDLADRDEAIASLETELAGSKTAENEASTRAEELQNQVSTLSEAAAEMEDGLQLADAEASIAARECEALRADLERTARLYEEELAMAEAALDGDLADRDDAIAMLETEMARATSEAKLSSESLQGDVSRLQEEIASAEQHATNAEEGRRVAEQLLIRKQSEMQQLESDYRLKEAKIKSDNNEVKMCLGEVRTDLQRMEEKLVASEAAVEEGKVTVTTLETATMALSRAKAELETDLSTSKTANKKREEDNLELVSRNSKLTKDNKSLRRQINTLEQEINTLEQENEVLEQNYSEWRAHKQQHKNDKEAMKQKHQIDKEAMEREHQTEIESLELERTRLQIENTNLKFPQSSHSNDDVANHFLCQICFEAYGEGKFPVLMKCCETQLCIDCFEKNKAEQVASLSGNARKCKCYLCKETYHCTKDTPWVKNRPLIAALGINID